MKRIPFELILQKLLEYGPRAWEFFRKIQGDLAEDGSVSVEMVNAAEAEMPEKLKKKEIDGDDEDDEDFEDDDDDDDEDDEDWDEWDDDDDAVEDEPN